MQTRRRRRWFRLRLFRGFVGSEQQEQQQRWTQWSKASSTHNDSRVSAGKVERKRLGTGVRHEPECHEFKKKGGGSLLNLSVDKKQASVRVFVCMFVLFVLSKRKVRKK